MQLRLTLVVHLLRLPRAINESNNTHSRNGLPLTFHIPNTTQIKQSSILFGKSMSFYNFYLLIYHKVNCALSFHLNHYFCINLNLDHVMFFFFSIHCLPLILFLIAYTYTTLCDFIFLELVCYFVFFVAFCLTSCIWLVTTQNSFQFAYMLFLFDKIICFCFVSIWFSIFFFSLQYITEIV